MHACCRAGQDAEAQESIQLHVGNGEMTCAVERHKGCRLYDSQLCLLRSAEDSLVNRLMMAGTFVYGEQLEKGGKKELEPGKSIVTIGRCEMTITLLRTKPIKSKDRGGKPQRQASVLWLCEHKMQSTYCLCLIS